MKKIGKGIFLRLIILVGSFLFIPPALCYGAEKDAEVGKLYALSAVLMDGESGRILYEKNGGEQRPMASTTKIMTCILVLENSQPEETATVSAYAASMPKVHLGVQAGERYRVEDLLYSLMLESHNDAAVVLAEHVAGSVESFANLMNQKAEEIGCRNTYFITPNGLDAEKETEDGKREHSTTAADLAGILRYCIQDSPKREEFLSITAAPSHAFSDCEGKQRFSCVNHNAFLTMMEGAFTGKTGFTAKAGYCYVGALKRDNKTFIVALLGCGWPNNKGYKWADTRKLMEYGLEHYHLQKLSDAELPKLPGTVPVENGQSPILGEERNMPLSCEPIKNQTALLGLEEKVEVVYQGESSLIAPVKKGERVGTLTYKTGDWIWAEQEITAREDIEEITFVWCLKQTIKRFGAG